METAAENPPEKIRRSLARYLWVMLLARIYEAFPLTCPQCGAEMRIIAFITEAMPARAILESIGEPVKPPRIAQARGPPEWYEDATENAVVFYADSSLLKAAERSASESTGALSRTLAALST